MQQFHLRMLPGILPFLLTAPTIALAQPTPPTQAEANAALSSARAVFSPQQLDQMLAPIALYPDPLLTELLMAATFPQQIIDAEKWLQDPNNAALTGDALVAALQPLAWDPSVKSLAAFPQIIGMMNNHFDWTQALGLAFANQQAETMARIQFLRQRAVAAGQLKSTPQLRISSERSYVVIEPVDPAMIYVPVYNPVKVYGQWPDHDYPPVFVPPPPNLYSGEIGAAIGFSIGFAVAGPLWGWGHPDWSQHEVVIDPKRYTNITSATEITNNHIAIENNVWHRTAAVAEVPEPARPHPPTATAPHPPGTVTPAAIILPKPSVAHPPGAPPAHPTEPAVAHPPGAPPPHPTEPAVAHPPGASPPHPTEPAVAHPPGAPPPHPTEPAVAHPPGAPSAHPTEPTVAHPPGAPPPHPTGPVVSHPPAQPGEKKPPPKPGEEKKEPDQH
jgi:Protein of unknown function (DUF3300)